MSPPPPPEIRRLIHECCEAFDSAWRAAVDQQLPPPLPADYFLTLEPAAAEVLASGLRQVDIDYALLRPDLVSEEELAARWPQAHATGTLAREIRERKQVGKPSDRATNVADITSPSQPDWSPGEWIAERFRIVQSLGQGGMGQVYLAEDDELNGELVAIKVLRVGNVNLLRREVELARKVTHPNVCRVHDLIAASGQTFLSMEYIPGQGLDKLLRQAGKLNESRAKKFAIQICQGLQAAHDKKVLHRDLKPANVLIDDNGEVHLADFGLACSTQDGLPGDGGTILYMSPEQLAGQKFTPASDIYSLGLVLFEMYTGRRLFQFAERTAALTERRDLHLSEHPEFYKLSPQVRDTIAACLHVKPQDRLTSADDVRHLLNDQPVENLRQPHWNRTLARICLGLVLLSLAVVVALADRVTLIGMANPEEPRFTLRKIASDLLREKGYPAPVDFGAGLISRSSTAFVPDGRIWYYYRESPVLLVPNQFFPIDYWLWQSFTPGIVTLENPAPMIPGMVALILDEQGGLVQLHIVPGASAEVPATGFDLANWREVMPEACRNLNWLPEENPKPDPSMTFAYDKLSVWTARDPQTNKAWRLTTAEHRGQVIYVQCLPVGAKALRKAEVGVGTELYFSLLVLACLVAIHNIWRGVCDHRSAIKVAIVVFLVALLGHYLAAHHLWAIHELDILEIGLAMSLYLGFVAWVAYVAIEPFVRRYLPEAFLGWNRLLAGQFDNPILGRDLLIGTLLASFNAAVTYLAFLTMTPSACPIEGPNGGLVEPRTFLGVLLVWLSFSTVLSLLMLVSLIVARRLLPRWGAALACVLLWTVPFLLPFAAPTPLTILLSLALTSLTVLVLDRYGFLPLVVSWLVRLALLGPITLEATRWYSNISFCLLLAIVSIACYGMWSSTRSLLRAES